MGKTLVLAVGPCLKAQLIEEIKRAAEELGWTDLAPMAVEPNRPAPTNHEHEEQ